MRFVRTIMALVLAAFTASLAAEQPWQPVGPDGGTVRSLAFDPNNPDRIYLGTSAGTLYLSTDNGKSWSRFARLGSSAEMVLDHIVIDPSDPKNMFVAAWNAQMPNSDGDLFRSQDAGKTWEIVADLHGKSLRALSISSANPRVLVAGALDGIYRSRDGGHNWERISPENHAEIKNIESIAIDPQNADVIYAGTWHLPWKTEDGGKNWHSIKKGVIDDSDVFTIAIDQAQPANLFISACSGIYRSESAGELFRKIQGIPYSARRTRMLKMDPADHNVVYAGTTEGLWKTTDSGATWKHMTGSNIVINDVLVDPRQPRRVLLATDRGGVLGSDDGGVSFTASNRGFTHRQTAALLVDRNDSSLIYAGLLSDKEFGGVFVSHDAGQSWKQLSEGLDGRDVFLLRQASDNSIIAGTDHGIFQLMPGASVWISRTPATNKPDAPSAGKRPVHRAPDSGLNTRITALDVTDKRWFAATVTAFFTSTDSGETWTKQDLPAVAGATSISVAGKMVAITNPNAVAVSVNGGESWLPATKPLDPEFTINSVAIDAMGDIWLASRAGVYRSTDAGDSWKKITTLRLANILNIQFDVENHRMLVVSGASTNIFESADNGRTWTAISTGWPLRNLRLARGRLLGTTPFDGIVMQPEVTAAVDNAAGSGTR
ncbi:MAG TPA: YCF48-related protein [Candidatus Angelobacter sp.]|nr:YCF48-related protein [Candidatus Angelobacter sp.]